MKKVRPPRELQFANIIVRINFLANLVRSLPVVYDFTQDATAARGMGDQPLLISISRN